MQPVVVFDINVEVAYQIAGEVVFGQLEEQLILVHRVGTVDQHECEIGVSFVGELLSVDRIAVGHDGTASFPHVAQIELSAMQPSPGLHAIDDHSGHLAHLTLGIFFYNLLHVIHARLCVSLVQLAQTANEEEFIPIGS